jgi:hypothetical protein
VPGSGELTEPVGYAAWLPVVAVALPLLVLAWYAGVAWCTRERTPDRGPAWLRLRRARRAHLAELERVEAARRRGEIDVRGAIQAVSATARSFVASVSPLDARTMNLAQLRASAPEPLVTVVDAVYPPAFSPSRDAGAGRADEERLVEALAEARWLIEGWRS